MSNGQCFELDGIFCGILNEVINDLKSCGVFDECLPVVVPEKEKPVKIDPQVKFVYFGNRSSANNHEGIITIASFFDEKAGRVFYGVAYCAPSDVYDKQKGKMLAFERLCTGQNSVGFNHKNHRELTTRIMASIFANNEYPSWAKDTIDYEAYALLAAW